MKRKPIERVLQELRRLREESEEHARNAAMGYDEGMYWGEEDAYRIAIELLEKAMEE